MNSPIRLMGICFVVILLTGCIGQPLGEIVLEVNAKGTMTDRQAERLSFFDGLYLDGLTVLTDRQAVSLSKIESLLSLNGLTSLTDSQAESLSKIEELHLDGITTLTNSQAKSLSKVRVLHLGGLTSLTDSQAESLSRVYKLQISEALQPLIGKYRY